MEFLHKIYNWIFRIKTVRMNRNGTAMETLNMIAKNFEDYQDDQDKIFYRLNHISKGHTDYKEYHQTRGRFNYLVTKGMISFGIYSDRSRGYYPTELGLQVYRDNQS